MREPILVKSSLDGGIWEIVQKVPKKGLALWAADCAERVLFLFEDKVKGDERPRNAILGLRAWVRDEVSMMECRKLSSLAHSAARDAGGFSDAQAAARAAGQAVATAHARLHSYAASLYAASAVRNACGSADKSEREAVVERERLWQFRRLMEILGGE